MANGKKPVEKNKKNSNATANKKVVEAKIEETMSEDMVEKEDKIWVIIAVLLVILVSGAYIANKFTKVEEEINTEIKTEKTITENNDGTVLVKLKLESNVGLKSIKLEDGTVLNYNGKKEVEIKFTADENRKYKIVIVDVNGHEVTKEINVTGIKEQEEVKDEEEEELVLEVVTKPTNNNYYYPTTQAPVQQPVVTQPEVTVDEAIIEGVENGIITNEDVVLTVKGNYDTLEVLKNGVLDTTLTDTFTADGEYVVRALKNGKELNKIEFEIDKTAPVFYNVTDLITDELNTVKVFNIQANDKNEVTYLVKENGTVKEFENMIINEVGKYEVTATDVAGNVTTIKVNMLDLFTMALNQMIFNDSITINYNTELTDTDTYITTLEKLNEDTREFDLIGYTVGDEILNAGFYRLTVTIDGVDVVASFTIDKTAPVVDITVENNEATVTVTDDETGVKDVFYGFSNDKVVEPTEYNKLVDTIEKPTEDGEYYLWVEATDNALNKTTEVSEDTIIVGNNDSVDELTTDTTTDEITTDTTTDELNTQE